jgi:hypothetical protein
MAQGEYPGMGTHYPEEFAQVDMFIQSLEHEIESLETISKIYEWRKQNRCSVGNNRISVSIDWSNDVVSTENSFDLNDRENLNSALLQMTEDKVDKLVQVLKCEEEKDIKSEYWKEFAECLEIESKRLANLPKGYNRKELLEQLKTYAASFIENPDP